MEKQENQLNIELSAVTEGIFQFGYFSVHHLNL